MGIAMHFDLQNMLWIDRNQATTSLGNKSTFSAIRRSWNKILHERETNQLRMNYNPQKHPPKVV